MNPLVLDSLFINCHIATMAGNQLSIIPNGALGVTGKTFSWVGPQKKLPLDAKAVSNKTIDCKNRWILPGFVDCHTHLVFGGSRSKEFEMRLSGMSYENISRKGGGIFSTVTATRSASKKLLYEMAAKRVNAMIQQGITTLEIKSGYGLNLETEIKMLEVVKQLINDFPCHIEPTFLGAHTLPTEFKGRSKAYVDLVTDIMLPEIKKKKLATAVDVFCETIGFSYDETQKIFEHATALGFPVKLHAEQLSDSSGAALASSYNALSCDHLEYLCASGAKKMAEHNVTAVLLPGAFYYLKETQKPPVELLRELNIPVAVSTDLNPGTSPVFSMVPILNMACLLFDLTCEEALLGATINGAKALGLDHRKGSIEIGKDADFVVWDIESPIDLCYFTGLTPVDQVYIQGDNTFDLSRADRQMGCVELP